MVGHPKNENIEPDSPNGPTHDNTPTSPPVIELVIRLDNKGVKVAGFVNDLVLALGLIESGKLAIIDLHEQMKKAQVSQHNSKGRMMDFLRNPKK